MAEQPRIGEDVQRLRGLLARLSLDTKLLRLEQALRRKDWSDQPRAPAGQSDGGQWVAGGGGDGTVDPDVLRRIKPQWAQMPGAEPAQTREETLLEDGTRVLSIRIRAGRRDFDEQHAVTAPDGASRIFEALGATQTIRTASPARSWGAAPSRRTAPSRTRRSSRPSSRRSWPPWRPSRFCARSNSPERCSRFSRRSGAATAPSWAPRRTSSEGRKISSRCRRSGSDGSTSRNSTLPVRRPDRSRTSSTRSPRPFGRAVGIRLLSKSEMQFIGQCINGVSANRTRISNRNSRSTKIGFEGKIGQSGTSRLDMYHRPKPIVACVYDFKMGDRGLSWSNAVRYATAAKKYFPETQRIIMIQMRPRT